MKGVNFLLSVLNVIIIIIVIYLEFYPGASVHTLIGYFNITWHHKIEMFPA